MQWKSRIVLPLRCYVKSISGFQKFQNCYFDIFEALKLQFDDFLQFLRAEICQKQNSELAKLQKWLFLTIWNGQNWFHVKSEGQKDSENLHSVPCKNCIVKSQSLWGCIYGKFISRKIWVAKFFFHISTLCLASEKDFHYFTWHPFWQIWNVM